MLELTDVNAYYEKSHILHDLNLTVEDDEIALLLGRNGAGKTTTIRSVMGVVPRVTGSITYDGVELTDNAPDETFRQGISWIPEGRRIFTNLTVEENLEMGETETTTAETYEEIFDLFPRLEERKRQKSGTLSGGEQQMLAIGRALLSGPDLLLVDEPFEGLMPSLVTDLTEILRELRTEDMAMFITEQKTEKTLPLADTVYIIDSGKIQYAGTPDDLAEQTGLQEKYLGVQA